MTRLIFILIAIIGVSQAQTIQYIGAPTTTVISRGNFRTDSIFYLPKRTKAPTDTAAIRYQISDSSLYVWTGSQWVKAGGSGTISGSGLTGYIPQFTGTTTLDTSALYTLGSRLGIGTSTFAYNSTSTANIELNNTAGGILGFKRNDSARGYLWHTGDNMELANTTAGSIFFNTNSATRGSISSAGVWRLHNLAGTGDRVVVASSNGTLSATTSVTGLVDTLTIATRAWRQKGDDSLGAVRIGGTLTSGYLAKASGTTTLTNSLLYESGTNIGFGTTSPSLENSAAAREFTITRSGLSPANLAVLNLQGDRTGDGTVVSRVGSINFWQGSRNIARINGSRENIDSSGTLSFLTSNAGGALTSRFWIHSNGRIGANTTTDAGYQFDINGTLRTVNGAVFASSSGNVAIGVTTADSKLHVESSTPTITIKNPITASTDERTADNLSAGLITFGAYGSFPIVGSIELKYATNASFGRRANMIFSTRNPTSLSEGMRLSYDKELLIADTVDAGDYKLQVSGNIYNTGSITTGAPSGGSIKPWKIGEAATVSPTSPNRTLRVEVDGVVYYIHAKTTND